jgi:hypothetical protein
VTTDDSFFFIFFKQKGRERERSITTSNTYYQQLHQQLPGETRIPPKVGPSGFFGLVVSTHGSYLDSKKALDQEETSDIDSAISFPQLVVSSSSWHLEPAPLAPDVPTRRQPVCCSASCTCKVLRTELPGMVKLPTTAATPATSAPPTLVTQWNHHGRATPWQLEPSPYRRAGVLACLWSPHCVESSDT